jgi:hypothetical protein
MKSLRIAGTALVIIFALIGVTFTVVFVGMQLGWLNVRGAIDERNASLGAVLKATESCIGCTWGDSPEWAVVREGLRKDAVTIERVARETGVPARLIAAVVVPEQLRFFTSERETFKQIFEPLKILGSLSQFSLGVAGIKQDTAVEIERRLPAHLTPLISYPPGSNRQQLLFERLTDQHDHYWSYLYAALFIQEIRSEWALAGFPIDDMPGVTITLFNIGFENSHPHANPQVGGAEITVGDTTYTFGSLGEAFYTSKELRDIFPR